MLRPIYLRERECLWQQDHLRAFEFEDGVELHVHRKPEATEHPAALQMLVSISSTGQLSVS